MAPRCRTLWGPHTAAAWVVCLALLLAGCQSPQERLQKARALAQKGDCVGAAVAYQAVIAKDSESNLVGAAWLGLAQCQRALNQDGAAEEAAENALRLASSGDDAKIAALLLGDLALAKGDWAKAVEAGASLGQGAPSDPAALAFAQKLLDAYTAVLAPLVGQGKGQLEQALMRQLLAGLWRMALAPDSLQKAADLCGFTPPAVAVAGAGGLAQVDATKITVSGVSQESGFNPGEFSYLTRGTQDKVPSPTGPNWPGGRKRREAFTWWFRTRTERTRGS